MTLRVTYIGHATLLLEIGGLRLLTDPNFDRRLAGILPRASHPGPTARRPAPHAILLTHAHADHLSLASLAALARDAAGARLPPPRVYAPPAVARWLARSLARSPVGRDALDVRPASPGATLTLSPSVAVHVGRATHRGCRYGVDRWGGRGASNTYLVDAPRASGGETGGGADRVGAAVFFAGDTGLAPTSHELVARRLWSAGRRLDLALLPIGYAPWWKPGFRRGHLSGADALALFDRLDARLLVPYHWGTFHHLTSGPFDALRQLEPVLARYPRRADVRIVPPGGIVECGP